MHSMTEENYLTEVSAKLEEKIVEVEEALQANEKNYKELKHYTIDYKNELDKYEVYNHHQNLNYLDSRSVLEANVLKKLNYQKATPYFSKIAFQFDEEDETEDFYIGRYGFADKYGEQLIYDWRAPISSMYYDFSLGDAYYESHNQKFFGQLRLKRQFEIKNGKIELIVDTNDAVNDELLMRELGKSTSNEMKTIIHTIQREQNAAIRDTKTKNLVIQGAAGSGKTSIALHRMAYLLYQKKEELSSADILIVSPNQVFADYISTVLPELGEDDLPQVDIVRLGMLFIEENYQVTDRQDELKETLENPDSKLAANYRYKQSKDFFTKLKDYFEELKAQLFSTEITIADQRIFPEEVKRLVDQQTDKSLFELIQEVSALLSKRVSEPKREVFSKQLEQQFKKNVKITGSLADYYKFLAANSLEFAKERNTIHYSDLFPYLLFKSMIEGIKPNKQVKHLVIDEMQDYSVLQLSVIDRLFPCQKTICGDVHQSLVSSDTDFLTEIQSVLPNVRLLKFMTSYRSSFEIMTFAKQFIDDAQEIQPVERHGKAVEIHSYEKEVLKQKIADFKESDHKSCGIICQDWQAAAKIEAALPNEPLVRFEKETKKIAEGIILTTTQFAKGLEFDQVILPDIRRSQLSEKSTRLYTSCSRALHELTLLVND
ncbi:HelD family protein [Candidatus Enterococcus murrayae]|uniref:AAA family ATPase n=1 Tax=Candidatus Enterococcus murrayae TaxID=2815321 RepID=A0ABS3HFY6_9ENTE|nr:UvrD-helicase domain-containing protein [Enterococcus sp. MJM16]MBO0452366.1 AAA family ATPase [Enterococcus sp. MJM16]